MENFRYLRISIPGLMFILTLLSINCSSEKVTEFVENTDIIGNDLLIAVIGIFLASPIIGLIVSTIAYATVHIIIGYKIYFPNNMWNSDYSDKLFTSLSKTYKVESINKDIKQLEIFFRDQKKGYWTCDRNNFKRLFDLYQILLRKKMKSEIFSYSKTAWNFFYINLNNQFAIILALIVSVFIPSTGIENYQWVMIFFIILYFGASIWHLFKCRRDAVVLEMNWILSLKTTPHNKK